MSAADDPVDPTQVDWSAVDFAPADFLVEPVAPPAPVPTPILPTPQKPSRPPTALQQLLKPLPPPFVSAYVRSKTPAQLYAEETATILVNGMKFSDWETVMVHINWGEATPIFKFTTADRVEVPMDWRLLQFKPGDQCGIYLGGELAIKGVIVTRQVAYDANNHGVQLTGKGLSWWASRASIIPQGDESVGNYDDKSFEQVAREVLAPTGVELKVVGVLDPTPFVRLQSEPGETIWAFLERIARPRGIVLGSNRDGNLVAIGPHSFTPTADLVEGVNIKKAQVTITNEDTYSKYVVLAQTAASDAQNGAQASEQKGEVGGSAVRYSPKLTTAEQPVWGQAEVQARAAAEAIWSEGTVIQATITVQGWMRPSDNQLWQAGDDISISSHMAMLNQVMKIQSLTHTQSRQAGTETVLDLVLPKLFRDLSAYDVAGLGNFDAVTGQPGAGSILARPGAKFDTFPLKLE